MTHNNSKTLATLAYIIWIPSLFIVLTEKRKEEFVGFHGCQALLLWTWIFVIFFGVRFFVNLIWSVFYIPYLEITEVLAGAALWGYALYCGYRSYQGMTFVIPH